MDAEQNLHPSEHFASPEAVLKANLSQAEKTSVLTNWANEIRQLQVAEEENMTGSGRTGERLKAVEQALLVLGDDAPEHDAKA